ncbi:hypothetical protein ABPG74_016474 [Tetrahymena malaccensis]
MIEFDKLFENEMFLKKLQVVIDERFELKVQKGQNEVVNDKSFNESVILPRNQESTNDLFGDDEKNQKSLRNEFEKLSTNHKNNEENISQFIEEIKKEKDQDQLQDFLGDINTSNQSDQIQTQYQQQMEQMHKRKEQIIGQLNNVLIGITQFNLEQQLKKLLDSIESRLGRCEKVCLEKLVTANSSNQLNNQNLESISKNFTTIHSEIKKINSFLDVIQEEQLHQKLKIEESYQTTKKPHHSRNKSVQNQNNFINGQYNSMGGGDFIPDVILQELQMHRIDIDAKDESIKHLEHKIIKVQQDCFKLEEDQEEKFKIFEEKIINIWQSIAFMTENITEINRKLEKKKSGIFF